jgi:hypothetical protein
MWGLIGAAAGAVAGAVIGAVTGGPAGAVAGIAAGIAVGWAVGNAVGQVVAGAGNTPQSNNNNFVAQAINAVQNAVQRNRDRNRNRGDALGDYPVVPQAPPLPEIGTDIDQSTDLFGDREESNSSDLGFDETDAADDSLPDDLFNNNSFGWSSFLDNPLVVAMAEPYAERFLNFVTADGWDEDSGQSAVSSMASMLTIVRQQANAYAQAEAVERAEQALQENIDQWLQEHRYGNPNNFNPGEALEDLEATLRYELGFLKPNLELEEIENAELPTLLLSYFLALNELNEARSENSQPLNSALTFDVSPMIGFDSVNPTLSLDHAAWEAHTPRSFDENIELMRQDLQDVDLSLVGLNENDLQMLSAEQILRTYGFSCDSK